MKMFYKGNALFYKMLCLGAKKDGEMKVFRHYLKLASTQRRLYQVYKKHDDLEQERMEKQNEIVTEIIRPMGVAA